jgi:hypothetical protein
LDLRGNLPRAPSAYASLRSQWLAAILGDRRWKYRIARSSMTQETTLFLSHGHHLLYWGMAALRFSTQHQLISLFDVQNVYPSKFLMVSWNL